MSLSDSSTYQSSETSSSDSEASRSRAGNTTRGAAIQTNGYQAGVVAALVARSAQMHVSLTPVRDTIGDRVSIAIRGSRELPAAAARLSIPLQPLPPAAAPPAHVLPHPVHDDADQAIVLNATARLLKKTFNEFYGVIYEIPASYHCLTLDLYRDQLQSLPAEAPRRILLPFIPIIRGIIIAAMRGQDDYRRGNVFETAAEYVDRCTDTKVKADRLLILFDSIPRVEMGPLVNLIYPAHQFHHFWSVVLVKIISKM